MAEFWATCQLHFCLSPLAWVRVAMLVGLHLSGKRHNFAKRADNEQMGLLPQGMIIGKFRVADSFWTLSNFCSNRNKCVLKNVCTIKVCVSCCWQCPGTFAPSAPHLTASLYLCISKATYALRLRALEGHYVSSKSPSRIRDSLSRLHWLDC